MTAKRQKLTIVRSLRAKAMLGPVAAGDILAAKGIDAPTHRVKRVKTEIVVLSRIEGAERLFRHWKGTTPRTEVHFSLVDVLFDRVQEDQPNHHEHHH